MDKVIISSMSNTHTKTLEGYVPAHLYNSEGNWIEWLYDKNTKDLQGYGGDTLIFKTEDEAVDFLYNNKVDENDVVFSSDTEANKNRDNVDGSIYYTRPYFFYKKNEDLTEDDIIIEND